MSRLVVPVLHIGVIGFVLCITGAHMPVRCVYAPMPSPISPMILIVLQEGVKWTELVQALQHVFSPGRIRFTELYRA